VQKPEKHNNMIPLPSPETVYALAAEAHCDPRTLISVLRGERPEARSSARARARAVLQKAGLLPADGGDSPRPAAISSVPDILA
jgi:hypothetical protein